MALISWLLRWGVVLVTVATECDEGDDPQLLQGRKDPIGELRGHLQERTSSLSRLPSARVSGEVMVKFPVKEVPEGKVGKDMGNTSRRHFFIIGPEGSSTRFWSMQLANGMNLTNADNMTYMKGGGNHLINNLATLSHLSLPFGSTCGHKYEDVEEPILMDFGGREGAYEYNGQDTIKLKTMMGMGLPIFFVDPLEVVKAHHQRGDAITMLLVLRDPRASLQNKELRHCKIRSTARKEQKKAFELILKAARAAKTPEYQQDIHVVCYEDIVDKGAPYVKNKLRLMGVESPSQDEVQFFDGNDKYGLEGHDCESDSLAYAELCPETEFSRQVKASCVAPMQAGSEAPLAGD